MIQLRDKETGRELGTITESQLEFLMSEFEEESSDDHDYYLNTVTLEMLAERSADPELLALLRRGLGDRQEMEIEWVRI
jgi:hypothetical protein